VKTIINVFLFVVLYMMHRDFIYTEGVEKLHQNSVNLTCMGPDRCRIIKYSALSGSTYTE